jgi:predicted dehydrogenase
MDEKEEETKMKVGIGFLGLGHVHIWDRAGAAAENANVEILGAYDPDEALLEKFCATYQVKRRPLAELLDDESIRLIYIVGKTYESPAYIISSLEHGKHVLVEKPGSPSLKEMDLVVAKAEKASTVARVGYSWEFLPIYADIRSMLESNALGKITFARVHMGYPAGALQKDFFCWPHSPGGVFYETTAYRGYRADRKIRHGSSSFRRRRSLRPGVPEPPRIHRSLRLGSQRFR